MVRKGQNRDRNLSPPARVCVSGLFASCYSSLGAPLADAKGSMAGAPAQNIWDPPSPLKSLILSLDGNNAKNSNKID